MSKQRFYVSISDYGNDIPYTVTVDRKNYVLTFVCNGNAIIIPRNQLKVGVFKINPTKQGKHYGVGHVMVFISKA